MNSKKLIIYEYQILFEILNEIKEKLDFSIINTNKKDFQRLKVEDLENFIIISKNKNDKLHNCLILNDLPVRIEKLLELININFLKKNFVDQSSLKIGKYNLDLNSREIIYKNKKLNLTEREANLIIFISKKKNVSVDELQKDVWGYVSQLETHTVETHIYRLRKKMKDHFNDDYFINSSKNGYSIN
tara:strand:+ start:556 stop:1116 length:561 start_codon:yes stop_codon:yes gene_type:complete